jgi:uncharacterized protein
VGARKNVLSQRVEELLARYQHEFSDFVDIKLVDVNQHGVGEDAPLHLAARHGLLKDIETLVEGGADLDSPGDLGFTPLHYAAMSGQLEAAMLLSARGASVIKTNEFGQTPLEVAQLGGHKDTMEFLARK